MLSKYRRKREYMRSSLRDALDTMSVSRSGRPVSDLLRMAAKLGSSLTDTAAVLDTEAERVIAIVEGRDQMSQREADLVHSYLLGLWWWHSWRSGYKDTKDSRTLDEVKRPLASVWGQIPALMRADWASAKGQASKKT